MQVSGPPVTGGAQSPRMPRVVVSGVERQRHRAGRRRQVPEKDAGRYAREKEIREMNPPATRQHRSARTPPPARQQPPRQLGRQEGMKGIRQSRERCCTRCSSTVDRESSSTATPGRCATAPPARHAARRRAFRNVLTVHAGTAEDGCVATGSLLPARPRQHSSRQTREEGREKAPEGSSRQRPCRKA